MKSTIKLLGVLGMVALCSSCAAMPFIPKQDICGMVTGKERVAESTSEGSHSYYLIFLDGNPYKNVDDISVGKINSSDIYGDMHEGDEVCVTVAGWRNRLLSMYQNIISVRW